MQLPTQEDSAAFSLQVPSICGCGRITYDNVNPLSLLCMDLDRQSIGL